MNAVCRWLHEHGEIPSLVDNERLMSTRFIGDKGYAVTFRYIDPLVTLDLTEVAAVATTEGGSDAVKT